MVEDRAHQHTRLGPWRLKQKSRRGIRAPRRLVVDSFTLSHPEGIERRLIDRRRRGEPLIGLVGGERLAGQRPEQSIHLTPVIAHLLQLSLHVRDHAIRRFRAVTHIDRSVVGIIFGRRIVNPCRIPVAVVPEVVTATDQLHAVVMRSVPALIVPFRTIRAEYFVLRTLPAFASLNPTALVKRHRRNLLRFWLRTEVRVLRFYLLHVLRFGLLRLGPHISLRVLLAGWRNWSWRSCSRFRPRRCRSGFRRCLRTWGRRFHSFPALLRLLLRTGRRRAGPLTGNIPFRRGGSCRFLARWSFPALPCTGLSRSSALGRRATFLHRSGLLRGRGLRLRRFPLRLLCFSRARFFRCALAL